MEAVATSSTEIESRSAAMRSSLVFAVGGALPRAVSFLLLPLYTHALSTAEYGTVSLLLTVSSLASIVLLLGLDFALTRRLFVLEASPAQQSQEIASIWRFVTFTSLAVATLLGVAAAVVVGDSGDVSRWDLLLALEGAALIGASMSVPLAVLRVQQRLRAFLHLTISSTVATSGLTVLLVVVLDLGVTGWLIAALAGFGVTFLVACALVPWQRGSIDSGTVRRALHFSLPMMPHFVSFWGLQLADRALLATLVSASALGVFSLASNAALPAMVAVQAIGQGFMPFYARARAAHQASVLAAAVVVHAAAVAFITLAVAVLAPPLILLAVPDEYEGAGALIAWIVLGYGFLGLYSIPMNGASLGAGRTEMAWIATAAALVVNLGAIFFLVPDYGLTAAAIASVLGYATLFLGVSIWARLGATPVTYRWPPILACVAVAVSAYSGSQLTIGGSEIRDIVIGLFWVVGAGAVMALICRERAELIGPSTPS